MTNGEKNVTTNAQPMVAQVFGTHSPNPHISTVS